MQNPPSGTVTFLFTDIEGSTRRWDQHREEMSSALSQHDAILRSCIEQHGGYVFKTVGDAFCAAFPTPLSAIEAAHALQTRLAAELPDMKVRAALHTGMSEEREGDYFGPTLNRVARLLSAGHGGQTLLSGSTYDLVRDYLPTGISLLDMGEHHLKDLFRPEHVFQVVAPDLPSEFPPLKTLDNRPNNLPVQPTPLIGREKQVGDVAGLLSKADVRLVTLTGPGGTGKTRLALQVSADMLDRFPDGVWFVELAALVEAKLVMSTVAQLVGVKETGGTAILDTLKEHLKDKHLLLVLDNFEQVANAAKDVSQLLSAGTGVKVLVTSRIPLRIKGEREYVVPPLSLPDPRHLPALEKLTQYEAVRLFIERATSVKADFEVTNDNAPAVAEICVRLDGLPLAIELAAARIRLFPPQALLSRLSSRLKLLTGGARDASARQQTLRGAIDWSYDLLSDGEQQLFRRLAVFQGGRTFEAIEAVCNAEGDLQIDMLDGVESLVSKSLLKQEEGAGGEPRFIMLETIQEYAAEKLDECGEAEELRRRHANYFLGLAEEAEPQLVGPQQPKWLSRLDDVLDNLRAALQYLQNKGSNEELLRLAGSLWYFWWLKGYLDEGREQLSRAMATGPDRPPNAQLAKVLTGAAVLAFDQADYQTSLSLLERSVAMYRQLGHDEGLSLSLNTLAWEMIHLGENVRGKELAEESLLLSRKTGDRWHMAGALNTLGIASTNEGDAQQGIKYIEESLALFREIGDLQAITAQTNNLGYALLLQADYGRAGLLLRESLDLAEKRGDSWTRAATLGSLGLLALDQSRYTEATTLFQESLSVVEEIGDKRGIISALEGLAQVAAAQDNLDRAVRLWSVAVVLREAIGLPQEPADQARYEQSISSLRSRLSEAVFSDAWQKGRAMNMEQAIAYALGEAKR